MGNCQASDAAAVLLQHPGGRVERMYWPTTAGDVMKGNPGYYVALITVSFPEGIGGTRVTHVRLLRAKDMLLLGQVYRLVTSQEVIKGLRARKQEKPHKKGEESSDTEKHPQVPNQQRQRRRSTAAKVRHWRPSLQSISEAVS